MHTEELSAPISKEYFPMGQLLQVDEPKVSEKVPAEHGQQAAPLKLLRKVPPSHGRQLPIRQALESMSSEAHEVSILPVPAGQSMDAEFTHPCQNIPPPPP